MGYTDWASKSPFRCHVPGVCSARGRFISPHYTINEGGLIIAIDTTELLARVCAIEQEATAALGIVSDAVPRWQYQQEKTSYFRNRIVSVQLVTDAGDDGQEVDTYRYTIGSAFHYANVSAGYDGENDEALLTVIPQIIQYFDERETLQSAAYPVGMAWLRYAFFQSAEGYVNWPYGAAGGLQMGAAFTFTCVFDKYIEQMY